MLLAAVMGIAGCGSNYRPTTTPITGTGPASQPAAYAFVISTPSSTAPGIGTVIDYSGDTVMATAGIGPGPVTFAINSGGNEAWSLNSDGTVANIPVSTTLQAKNVTYSTLNPLTGTGVDPVVTLFSGSLGLYALDVSRNQVDVLTGSPDAFKLTVPVDVSPVTMVGVPLAQRYYSISQTIPYLSTSFSLDGNTVDGGVACNIDPHNPSLPAGVADAIETSPNYTVSNQIPLGVCPVYAIGTLDARRVFVLNRGSDTVTVIDAINNTLDNRCLPPTGCVNQNGQKYFGHPCLPLSQAAVSSSCPAPTNSGANLPAIAGPVYAEYNPALSEIVISNYDGNTISIIDVSLDEYGNDSQTFGTTYTVPVGKNPASVTVLADGTRAYVANQSDSTVSIVNMSSHAIETTLPVTGHPRTVVSVANSLYGKVYVASPDSPYVSIIRTDQDILSTTVLVQGNAIDVRTTSPDAINSNENTISRLPGAGQPCYLPPSEFASAGAPLTVANCRAQSVSEFTTAAQ
jgi:YVTN family beta-propeller protein